MHEILYNIFNKNMIETVHTVQSVDTLCYDVVNNCHIVISICKRTQQNYQNKQIFKKTLNLNG